MRGTKLKAWQIPPAWKNLQENSLSVPEGSNVPQNQKKMFTATGEVLTAIAGDVREGLLETVGVESSLSLDEPTAALDPKSQGKIVDFLVGWSGAKTVVTATHDLDIVEDIADYCFVFQNGQVVGEGTPARILADDKLLESTNLIHAHRHAHSSGIVHSHSHRFHERKYEG